MNGALRDASGTGSVDVYSQLHRVQRAAPAAIGLSSSGAATSSSSSTGAAASSSSAFYYVVALYMHNMHNYHLFYTL